MTINFPEIFPTNVAFLVHPLLNCISRIGQTFLVPLATNSILTTNISRNNSRMVGGTDYGYETWSEKFMRKFNENPWVPLGCAATTAALVMSSIKMRSGKSKDMQTWLRARVVFQGVTILALVAGSMALQASKKNKVETAESEVLKEAKEKLEFEERLKGAELAHAEEKAAVAAALLKKSKSDVGSNGTTISSPIANEPGTVQKAIVAVSSEEKGKSSGSWSKWLGWGSSSGSKSEEKKP